MPHCFPGAYVIDDTSIFGESELSAVVGEVHCVGTEPELVECSHRTFGRHFCGRLGSESVPDLAISCYGMYTYALTYAHV